MTSRRWGCLSFVLALGAPLPGQGQTPCRLLTHSEAIPVLARRLDDLGAYGNPVKRQCLAYVAWRCAPEWIDVDVHEDHRTSCGGDPASFPVVDHFRVSQDLKTLQWYDLPNDQHLPLEKLCEQRQCAAPTRPGATRTGG